MTAAEAPTYQAVDLHQAGPYRKMQPEVKAAWVAALRSGDYLQGTGTLALTDPAGKARTFYCCLGVLCEVGVAQGALERRPTVNWEHHFSYRLIRPGAFGERWVDTATSHEIDTWAGLDPAAPDPLIRMNDSEQRTFGEIADWIEVNL